MVQNEAHLIPVNIAFDSVSGNTQKDTDLMPLTIIMTLIPLSIVTTRTLQSGINTNTGTSSHCG